ncbi:MAG: SHOCT domain-containing protein [Candidatus Dormibacteraeota bacterium]|nr:SHOCT domain-containing protein [Candidatus Dormibacteraeota bacterium]
MDIGMMGFGFLWMLFGFLIFAGILAVGIWAIIHFAASSRVLAAVDGSSARRILDERYARGEISQEEYQRIRREIS